MEELTNPVPSHETRRRLRKLSGLTQLELAHRSGISQSSLSRFERGHEGLPTDNLAKLDEVLNDAIQHRRDEFNSGVSKPPGSVAADHGLSPRESVDLKDVELGELGRGRRAVLRGALDLGWAVVGAAVYEEFVKRPGKSLISIIYDPDADRKLLEQLFGVVGEGGTGALVAAADHPFRKPPEGADWYPTEVRNCVNYKKRFLDNCALRQVSHDPDIMPIDGLVLFGSQVSNYKTRQYFGNFLREKPHLNLVTNRWRVKLHWNLYTPDSAQTMERWQFGAEWKTWHHRLGGLSGDEFLSIESRGELEDDYLLVTALPHSGAGKERVVVFAGLHGPGQKATNILLCNPPTRQLTKLWKEIDGEPFYQALFHVPLKKDDNGEFAPKDVELVSAKSLKPSFG